MGTLEERGAFPLPLTLADIMYVDKVGGGPTQDGYVTLTQLKALMGGAGAVDLQDGYNATTNTPDLDVSPGALSILKGWQYFVTVAGTFFTEAVEIGDVLTAKIDSPTTLAHWIVVQANLTPAAVEAVGALMRSGGTMTGGLVTAGVTESVDASPITVSANPEVLVITGKTVLQTRLRTATAEVFTMPTAASNNGKSFTLWVHQVLTGNPVATSATFTGVDWGVAGTFVVSNLNDKVDILTFYCLNNKWYGTAGKGFGV